MPERARQTVGERGQVTLPKEIRERLGIDRGDEVVVYEEEGKIVVEKPVTREELAEGYRASAERARKIEDDIAHVSREANDYFGDAPEW